MRETKSGHSPASRWQQAKRWAAPATAAGVTLLMTTAVVYRVHRVNVFVDLHGGWQLLGEFALKQVLLEAVFGKVSLTANVLINVFEWIARLT